MHAADVSRDVGIRTRVSGFLKGVSALDPKVFFLVISLLGGAAYIVVTPPFRVPDEPAHFFRAYSVSLGSFNAPVVDGAPGAHLPSSLKRLERIFIVGPPSHPDPKLRPGMWSAARAVELEPEATELIRFPKSLQYSAIPYLPQAARNGRSSPPRPE